MVSKMLSDRSSSDIYAMDPSSDSGLHGEWTVVYVNKKLGKVGTSGNAVDWRAK